MTSWGGGGEVPLADWLEDIKPGCENCTTHLASPFLSHANNKQRSSNGYVKNVAPIGTYLAASLGGGG